MRIFAQKPKAQHTTSTKSTIPGRAYLGQSREVNPILHLQHTVGNRALQRTGAGELGEATSSIASPRFGHDFSRIPVNDSQVRARTSPEEPASLGNNTLQRLINSARDESMPGVDPVEEDVFPGAAMAQNEPLQRKCDACGGGQGDCPKCALAAISSDSVYGRAAGGQLARHPIAILQRSAGNLALLRLINSPGMQAQLNAGSAAPVQDRMWMPRAATSAQDGPTPMQAPPAAHTYTFISRGSYGQTDPGFTRPSCAAGAGGTATLVAGSAAPNVTVFPNGTYSVRREDGVVQTATCTRLAAGLAATRAHEDSHAAGARNAVASANTAQGLPRNYPSAAACGAALPAILTPWNTTVDGAWANEVAHGPGTNQPTPQTFTVEHAAGTCTFA
jgi:hypothetical protein